MHSNELPGDDRWDINTVPGIRNDDGTWDVLIRARVRLDDEVGAQAFLAQAGSPDGGLPQAKAAVTHTVANALIHDELSGVTVEAATVGVGLDDFHTAVRTPR